MDVEQKLIEEIRSHGNIQVICRLCDEIENLNEMVAVPIMDGQTFPSTFLSMAISCVKITVRRLFLVLGATEELIRSMHVCGCKD